MAPSIIFESQSWYSCCGCIVCCVPAGSASRYPQDILDIKVISMACELIDTDTSHTKHACRCPLKLWYYSALNRKLDYTVYTGSTLVAVRAILPQAH